MQWPSKFREMPAEHIFHGVVLHPVDAFMGVNLWAPTITGKETVRLDTATGHQDEHTKGSVTEAETFRQRLAESADKEVHGLNVTVVDLIQISSQLLIATSELDKGTGWGHVKQTTEGIVARDAAFTIPKDVDSTQVQVAALREVLVFRNSQVTEEVGHVVGTYRTRVVNAEGVKNVCKVQSQASVISLLLFSLCL